MSATAAEPLAHYRAAFESVSAGHAGTAAQRAAAFERFAALGFPGAREEAWKYTSLRRLESRRFPVRADSVAAIVLPAALVVVLQAPLADLVLGPGAGDAPLGGLTPGILGAFGVTRLCRVEGGAVVGNGFGDGSAHATRASWRTQS